MEERQVSSIESKRDRQPISIPFLWEEKPGTPKKDWKHPIPSVPIKPDIDARLPVKLVVSVPFRWEEKPGTPLPGFLPRSMHESRKLDHDDGNWINGNDDDDDDGLMDGSSFDSEVDTRSFGTDDSFSSAPSLLANGLISTMDLASAIPVLEKTLQSLDSPAAYETYHSNSSRSSISSCETAGSTSLVGASFLEWLFPLLVPNSSSPDKVGTGISSSLEKNPSHKADQVQGPELLPERNGSQIRRSLLTLGEMIAMSRRRSYQRKVINMRKQTSMDFMKRNTFGCGIFGNSNAAFNRLHRKWKRHLQLNFM